VGVRKSRLRRRLPALRSAPRARYQAGVRDGSSSASDSTNRSNRFATPAFLETNDGAGRARRRAAPPQIVVKRTPAGENTLRRLAGGKGSHEHEVNAAGRRIQHRSMASPTSAARNDERGSRRAPHDVHETFAPPRLCNIASARSCRWNDAARSRRGRRHAGIFGDRRPCVTRTKPISIPERRRKKIPTSLDVAIGPHAQQSITHRAGGAARLTSRRRGPCSAERRAQPRLRGAHRSARLRDGTHGALSCAACRGVASSRDCGRLLL